MADLTKEELDLFNKDLNKFLADRGYTMKQVLVIDKTEPKPLKAEEVK